MAGPPSGHGEAEMNGIEGIPSVPAPKPIENVDSAAPLGVRPAAEGVGDVVEISSAAMLAAKIQEVPEIRVELVERVKAEIAAGTYETPERIEAAVERLTAELLGET
jgi:hypothetical protein